MNKSSLIKMSFEKLYELYDKSKDIKERELIKDIVENKKVEDIDESFIPYPDTNNPKFQDIIFKKKEFNSNQLFLDSTGIEDTCNSEFTIKPHQIMLKNFMTKESPYKSLLVYHGVGVGKTCSGLTVAENFRDIYGNKEKRILILSSKNIQIGWKKTIYSPEKGNNQCTGDTYTEKGIKTPREINKLIKQYYEIMAYQSFSNYVKKKQEEYIRSLPDNKREQGKIDWIRNYFSDRLLIIDEAHNIRDDQGTQMRDAVKTIEMVIRYSDNLRLLLLTATPMYNRVSEIVWMLNMMLLNDKKQLLNKKEIFNPEGELLEKGIEILKKKSSGYISYLRGENPITFPLRLTPRIIVDKNNDKLFPLYTKNQKLSILYKSNSPKLNLVGGNIRTKDKFSFLELLGSKIINYQEIVYNQAINNILERSPYLDLDARGEKNSILDNTTLIQITNISYPIISDNIKQELSDKTIRVEDCYGDIGLKKSMINRGNTYSYKKEVLDTYGPFFDKDIINNYSSKLSTLLNIVNSSDGIVFIYTNYIDSGITPLQLLLEQNGYKRYDKRKILSYPEYKQSLGYKCKREPISYDGRLRSDARDEFKQATFMVIDGSTNKNELSDQLNIVSSKSNANGEKIKIILGTVVASEGLDFKRIRSIHILDPWFHLNRIEQTIGRGIRFCSHSDLEDKNKNVLTFLHVGTLSDDRETIDTSIYRYAEKKAIQIGIVETILKKNAIDRHLYENVNVIGKDSLTKIYHKPCMNEAKEILIDPCDKSYSKICSYMKDCDYNIDLSIDYDINLDSDTFIERYSSHSIQNIKKKISLLYKEFYVFDIDSILGLMSEYGFNYEDMIYQALSEMILEKYILYGKHNSAGYIINRGSYYIYQPFLYEDTLMPLYYRVNLLQIPESIIKLDKINKIDEIPRYSAIYDLPSIRNIYERRLDDIINKNQDFLRIVDKLTEIYSKLTMYSESVNGYLFDRLEYSDKCGLIYGYYKKYILSDIKIQDIINKYIEPLIIYKSDTTDTYYFNDEITDYKNLSIFGFYMIFNKDKPQFYEFYDDSIQECNLVQIKNIKIAFERYSKQFKKHSSFWGYTIQRKKLKENEIVLKFVSPKTKETKFPPGPGNVCIENNIGSSKQKIQELIDIYCPELKTLMMDELLQNKKNICLLMELVMRYKNDITFYRLDTIVLKYI